jgi:uncharacterized protein YcbX
VASLTRISTTVVKGTFLDHPDSLDVGPHGYVRDRLFYFIDQRGVMLSSKRYGPLVQIHSEYDDDTETLTMRYPDGAVVSARIALTDERVDTNFWGRPVPSTVVDGPFAAAASAYIGKTVRMVRADVPGSATDLHPVTIVATATLDHFAKCFDAPTEHWRDRFRMLFELDGLEPFEEEAWIGRTLRVGELAITVEGPVPRCLVTRQNPRTGMKDFDTLKSLRVFRTEPMGTRLNPGPDSEVYGGFLLGMYATVTRPGVARVGDEVRAVDEASVPG